MNILNMKLDTTCPNCGAQMLRSRSDDPEASDMLYTCPVCALTKTLSYAENGISEGKVIPTQINNYRVISYFESIASYA